MGLWGEEKTSLRFEYSPGQETAVALGPAQPLPREYMERGQGMAGGGTQ